MANVTLTQEQLLSLFTSIATLTEQVKQLNETVQQQDQEIKKLISMAEQGKGSVWMLMAVGGVLGAIISHAKALFPLLAR